MMRSWQYISLCEHLLCSKRGMAIACLPSVVLAAKSALWTADTGLSSSNVLQCLGISLQRRTGSKCRRGALHLALLAN